MTPEVLHGKKFFPYSKTYGIMLFEFCKERDSWCFSNLQSDDCWKRLTSVQTSG